MTEVKLTRRTSEGTEEIDVPEGRTSFGRGGEVSHRLSDEGLSRVHASVFREGERIWIVDENSTNGSFVNGERVGPRGTVLTDGDEIRIGNDTRLAVRVRPRREDAAVPAPLRPAAAGPKENHSGLLIPIAVGTLALMIVGSALLYIGAAVLSGSDRGVVYSETAEDGEPADERRGKDKKDPKEPGKTPETGPDSPAGDATIETGGSTVQLPSGKYQDMSSENRDLYVKIRSEKIASLIGNQRADPIPPEAIKEIRGFVEGYLKRLKNPQKDSCEKTWTSSDLLSVLNRASRTSPMIIRYFRSEGVEPVIGIYIAMVESEHCPCLTSGTGAQGLFQFLKSSASGYGLDPERRCEPEESAKAGAKYLKSLIARYGTAPDSVPLAIASFNSGQGNLSKNLDKVLTQAVGENRSFWTLVANSKLLEGNAGKQFNEENIRYVPKFFATAIVGEHPADFGIPVQALSTYTK